MSRRACAGYLLALTLVGCAGDGSGLDQNGRPSGEDSQPLQPTLESIQKNVFTPICSGCHSGAAAPLGLRLTEDAAYALLVNVPSTEVPALRRVTPGNPDSSYLIQKIVGTAAVGGRMPLNAPPLPSETVAVIRQWIADGVPVSAAAAASLAQPAAARLNAAWPTPGAILDEPPPQIVIGADAELDTTLLTPGTVTLRDSGGDGDFSNGNERAVSATLRVRSISPTTFSLEVPTYLWRADSYEVRISGGAPLALADLSARPIDGDGDGASGGDFVLHFTLKEIP